MKKTLVSAALFMTLACNAQAGPLDFMKGWSKSNFYMGLLVSNSDIDGETGAGLDMSVINATLGYSLGKGLSVEGRFGAGSDQAESLFQDPVSNYAAGMLRYHYTWKNKIMAYAAAGGATRVHSNVVEADRNQTGAAFALGMNLFGSAKTAINVEYFYMGGAQATKSIGIGFHHYFGN
ncbi:hypothetical protein AB833_04775 [Chromatiales bacterium (ex Bugula neritina AB1)]|nr:hypothetical protein AB833_04775 [Chromatiales bacterium (ex Bugula neritina AB1)]